MDDELSNMLHFNKDNHCWECWDETGMVIIVSEKDKDDAIKELDLYCKGLEARN